MAAAREVMRRCRVLRTTIVSTFFLATLAHRYRYFIYLYLWVSLSTAQRDRTLAISVFQTFTFHEVADANPRRRYALCFKRKSIRNFSIVRFCRMTCSRRCNRQTKKNARCEFTSDRCWYTLRCNVCSVTTVAINITTAETKSNDSAKSERSNATN